MGKSADAFRTISEVSDWMQTPAHVLRFWESRFTQIKPVKRAGGRRYYRPTDMQLLSGIKKLLHEDGMTIKGVQKLMREKGVKHISALSYPIDIQEAPAAAPKILSPTEPEAPTPPLEENVVTQFPTSSPLPEESAPPAPTTSEFFNSLGEHEPDPPKVAEPSVSKTPGQDRPQTELFTTPEIGVGTPDEAPAKAPPPTAVVGDTLPDDPPLTTSKASSTQESQQPDAEITLATRLRQHALTGPELDRDKLLAIYQRLKTLRAQMDAPVAKKSGN